MVSPLLEGSGVARRYLCEVRVPVLLPPRLWPNFRKGRHGMVEFMSHVAEEDKPTITASLAMLAVYLEQHEVPTFDGKWTMKMLRDYGLLGDAMYGNSILGRDEASPNRQIIDNPVLDTLTNLRWRKGL